MLALCFLGTVVLGALGGSVHDVTTFGAVPDDGSDDLAAIQAAINVAVAGDTIFFPVGTFHITGQIQPPSGTRVAGVGRDVTTIAYLGAVSNPMIRLSFRDEVELTGFTLDGTNNPAVQHGVVGNAGSDHVIHGLRIRDLADNGLFGPHGVYFDNTANNVRVEDNEFVSIGLGSTFGSAIRFNNGSNNPIILRNTITDTGRGGIHCSGSTGAIIRDNVVSGSGHFAEALAIELFNGSHDAIVEDNRIDHWLSVDRSDRTAVRRNVVGDDDGEIEFIGLELVGSRNVIFADNQVDQGCHRGISISNTSTKERVLFARNHVRGAETWGLQISGEPGSITRQFYFLGNTITATDADPPTQFPNQGHGFRFKADTGPIEHVVLVDNRIVANDGIGIQLGGTLVDQLVLRDNRIVNNGGSAVTTGFGGTAAFAGADLLAEGNVATGNLGGDFVPASVGFVGNIEPSVSIRAPKHVAVGQPVRFAAKWTDDGALGQVLWDLGDGLPRMTQKLVHVYEQPGVYYVTVVAWDEQGRGTHATHRITVGFSIFGPLFRAAAGALLPPGPWKTTPL
jgi:parallel beta-helix repeat protein